MVPSPYLYSGSSSPQAKSSMSLIPMILYREITVGPGSYKSRDVEELQNVHIWPKFKV